MEHKAYIFDHFRFAQELEPILRAALHWNRCAELVAFVEEDLRSFSDPYEGEPLRDHWQEMVNPPDVHQYGDFALTKYYQPASDIGLGEAWIAIHEYLQAAPVARSAILGTTIEEDGVVFDPGKMGSYIQSASDVVQNITLIRASRSDELAPALEMLEEASKLSRGLYVTF